MKCVVLVYATYFFYFFVRMLAKKCKIFYMKYFVKDKSTLYKTKMGQNVID